MASPVGGMEVSLRSVGISCCQSWRMSVRRGQRWPWVEGASRRSCFEGFACSACQERGSGELFDLAAGAGLAALGVGCGHRNRALLSLFVVTPPIASFLLCWAGESTFPGLRPLLHLEKE